MEVVVIEAVVGDAAGDEEKKLGVTKLVLGKPSAIGAARDDAEDGINNKPAAIDQDFGDYVIGRACVGIEKKQAASGNAGDVG